MSQQINLFNPVFLKKNTLFSAATMLQALAVISIGLAAICGLTAYRLTNVRTEASIAADGLKSAQGQLEKMIDRTKPAQKDKSLEDAIKSEEERLAANRQVLDFVSKGDLGNTRGYAEFFRAFSRRNVQGVWLTSFALKDGGSEIEIQGKAMQPTMVPAYLAALRQDALFRGKSFGSLELHAPGEQANDKPASAGKGGEPASIEFILRSTDAIDTRTAQGPSDNTARKQ